MNEERKPVAKSPEPERDRPREPDLGDETRNRLVAFFETFSNNVYAAIIAFAFAFGYQDLSTPLVNDCTSATTLAAVQQVVDATNRQVTEIAVALRAGTVPDLVDISRQADRDSTGLAGPGGELGDNRILKRVFTWQTLLGIAALFFVLDDWYGSRKFLAKIRGSRSEYKYLIFRFWMDVTIAVVSYLLLMSAIAGSRSFGIFLVIILFLGMVWVFSIWHDRSCSVEGRHLWTAVTVHAAGILCLVSGYGILFLIERRATAFFTPFRGYGVKLGILVMLVLVLFNRVAAPWLIRRFGRGRGSATEKEQVA